jgi:nickel-dependent lactate racemase
MRISLPYGRSSKSGVIPDWAIASCVKPKEWRRTGSQENLVRTALARPHILPRLKELARQSRFAVIATCDRTRGVPSHITLPLIMDELRSGGLDGERVKVLVATGLHKGETTSDVKERFGSELLENLEVNIHDSDEYDQLSFLGTLRSGTPLFLNKDVVEADLIIIESSVEPHFFAGFTGGSKVILPGVAGTETILRNHSWKNIDDPKSRYGIVENPIRADANAALRTLKSTFALNLVLDDQKRIVHATAGGPIVSFNKAAQIVTAHSRILIEKRPDIVITTNGGYPLDRNVYQCVKGIAVPEEILLPGSKIIMVGECADGTAHEEFRRMLVGNSPNELYEKLKTSEVPERDQWEAQVLCRILRQNPVWFITRSELRSDIESMHMHYAATIEQALDSARVGKRERVLVVPEGPSAILKVR